jgi:sporulation protein YlmC with PRC-barrel domain
MPAERRASTLIGMPVVSADGNPTGEVKDIIFDRQGRATHLVIAYAGAPEVGPGETPDEGKSPSSSDGKLTVIPWDAALASMKDGRLVLDGAKLQDAPSFTPDAWPNLDDPSWSAAADAYWRKAVRAAIAAHPGNPVDSTARQRGRRSREGDGDGHE